MLDEHQPDHDEPRPAFRWTPMYSLMTAIGVTVMCPIVLYAMYRIMLAPFLGD